MSEGSTDTSAQASKQAKRRPAAQRVKLKLSVPDGIPESQSPQKASGREPSTGFLEALEPVLTDLAANWEGQPGKLVLDCRYQPETATQSGLGGPEFTALVQVWIPRVRALGQVKDDATDVYSHCFSEVGEFDFKTRFTPDSKLEPQTKKRHIRKEGNDEESNDLPPPTTIQGEARGKFDEMVAAIAAAHERELAELQPRLNRYLREWDEEQQRLTQEQEGRPAEEIAQAKKELEEHVKAALERLNISIYHDGKPCHLLVYVGKSNRRGQFWLKPPGESKPVANRANLSDLFNFSNGEPQLGISIARREPFVEWRIRENTRRKTNRSPDLGS
jgi:hypothetical protein